MTKEEILIANEKHELKKWEYTKEQLFSFAKRRMELSDDGAEVFKNHIVAILEKIGKVGDRVHVTSLLFYAEIKESAFYRIVIDTQGINYVHLAALRKYGNLVDFYEDANEYESRRISHKGNKLIKAIPKTVNI
jgi:hypothetical protein